jgi:hypothetical protein
MTECCYVPTRDTRENESHYRCETCGHERWSCYPPKQLHRKCGGAIDRVVEDIATDVTEHTRSLDAIRSTLEKCFSGCRHLRGYCRKRGAVLLCEQYQAWIEHLLEHDCEPE